MKCSKCDGTGQVIPEFVIPVWNEAEDEAKVTFTHINKFHLASEGESGEVSQCAIDFHAFLHCNAHGVFYSALRASFVEAKK